MRRIAGFILVLAIAASVSCSGRKKYSEISRFVNEVVTTQDEFLSKIDKSINAEDVVSAVDTFGTKLAGLSEKSMELKKKYPEIDRWVNDPPDALKADFDKLNDTGSKFEKVFTGEKIKILIRDKKVQDSFRDLNRKMDAIKFFQ